MSRRRVRRRLDDDAGIRRRNVRLGRDGDGRDLRRRLRVGRVDDPGIALAELDLRDDGPDVVLPRDDVRGIGHFEGRWIAGRLRKVRDDSQGIRRDGHVVAGGDDLQPTPGEIGRRRDPGGVVGRDDDG